MSGDAHDPVSAARPDHDPVLIWNGLVTRVRRSGGQRRNGKLTDDVRQAGSRAGRGGETRQAELLGIGTSNELVPEPTPIDLDLP